MNKDLVILLDWLQFTSFQLDEFQICEILGLNFLNDFVEAEKGLLGYKKQFVFNGGIIKILKDGKEDMGIHFIISGQGCRYLEVKNDLVEIIEELISNNCKFTRIDLACDDKVGLIRLAKLKKYLKNGWCSSRFKSYRLLEKRKIKDGNIEGDTIYFGSPTSRIMVRIYDKAKETKTNGHWIRIELEIKKERAEALSKLLILENTGKIFAGVLNNYIKFLEFNPMDTNKSRWKIDKDWLKIIESVDKLTLTKVPQERDIIDVKNWIERQASCSLALLLMHYDGEFEKILDIINIGYKKLKPRHLKLLKKVV